MKTPSRLSILTGAAFCLALFLPAFAEQSPQEMPIGRKQTKSRSTIIDEELSRIAKEFQSEPAILSEAGTAAQDSFKAPPRFPGDESDLEILNKAQYSVGGTPSP